MAETCIVCLSDLRQQDSQHDSSSAVAVGDDVHAAKKRSLRDTRLTSKSVDDDEIIAHLLPCKHNLHNACLKPWVERANSCPICRATFNQVELSAHVGGEIIDTYAVQDKVQEQIFDPTPFLDDEDAQRDLLDWDAVAPCIICDMIDETHEVMYCDGCDGTVHVFCAGYSDTPEVWYCSDCQTELGIREQPAVPSQGRTRRSAYRRGRQNDAAWARVWQVVSRRLDLDLDFPFSDDADDRTEEQRREFGRWERRFQVADRHQTSARRLRGIAARLHQPPLPLARAAPESQEEIRAWNAFEKARESQGAVNPRRKRQRTESPDSTHETIEQPQLKRPRLRRPPTTAEATPQAESSTAAAQRAATRPTFLSSLLREVEQKPLFAASPGASELNGHHSPRNSSPVRSPSSSGPGTPRGLSPSPAAPTSPPLCSTVAPPISPPGFTFSPFSPAQPKEISYQERHQRGRGRIRPSGALNSFDPAEPGSLNVPASKQLSLASKEEIQRMVKLALKPRYKEKQLTKDEYTDINRDVSRRMYELVGDTTALSDEAERARWQGIAEQEVIKAVSSLGSHQQGTDTVVS